ncbi:MAG: phosphoribosyltransferase family protein [Legionella sp.]|nr:phosphoribosyltransferase family protein [Legionella sp.]
MNILVNQEQIRERVSQLAQQISTDYAGLTLDVICLINSASMFSADLVRELSIPARLHFLGFNSYPNGNASGEVRITHDVNEPLFERHVLVIEGIVVSGRTPRFVLDMLSLRKPASLALCALGVKASQLAVDLPLKYTAFELGAEIATGYGVGSGTEKVLMSLVEKK